MNIEPEQISGGYILLSRQLSKSERFRRHALLHDQAAELLRIENSVRHEGEVKRHKREAQTLREKAELLEKLGTEKNFSPSRRFRSAYDRLFQIDPITANVLFLLSEIANEKGQVETTEKELSDLLVIRFDDPRAYQIGEE